MFFVKAVPHVQLTLSATVTKPASATIAALKLRAIRHLSTRSRVRERKSDYWKSRNINEARGQRHNESRLPGCRHRAIVALQSLLQTAH
jgi:hypothetical protein